MGGKLAEAADLVVALAAVVYAGRRYGDRPVYFSDVVVRPDSAYRCFADLAGCRWARNEPRSQSGVGVIRDRLAAAGLGWNFFGSITELGFHAQALRLVRSGEVETAVRPALRTISVLDPSPSQVVVANRRLSPPLRATIARTLRSLTPGHGVAGFAAVDDSAYDGIRAMDARATAAGVPPLSDYLAHLTDRYDVPSRV